MRVSRTGPGRPYAILVAPARSSLAQVAANGHDGRTGALVLVHDPDSRMPAVPEILARGLHLPPGAAKLVAALVSEEDLKTFADHEGITIHTARFHLRTALERTGARSQAELVGRAIRVLITQTALDQSIVVDETLILSCFLLQTVLDRSIAIH